MLDYDDEDFDPFEEKVEELLQIDADILLGLDSYSARNFVNAVSEYEGLWEDFLNLSSDDKRSVVETHSDEYTGDVDVLGLILFLQYCPGSEIMYLPGMVTSTDGSIHRMRDQLGLEFYPNRIQVSDELVVQLHSFVAKGLFADITSIGVAVMLDSQRDDSPLVEILEQASRSGIELSSYMFVHLITNWSRLQQYPVDWAVQIA